MPMKEQQNAGFAARLGGRVAEANAKYAGTPPLTNDRSLPPGIKGGVAKLSAMYTKTQEEDGKKCPKGETFFRASATVLGVMENGAISEYFKGQKIKGATTAQIIYLCDIPSKSGVTDGKAWNSPEVSFLENWDKFRSLFRMLGVVEPPSYIPGEDPNTEEGRMKASNRIQAYYFSAMKALTAPGAKPLYIEFETREFNKMVFETWVGTVKLDGLNGAAQPGSKVNVRTPAPPTQQPTQSAPAQTVGAINPPSINDLVAAAPNHVEAREKLEHMAWANGWTKEQTAEAEDWAAVGKMASAPPATSNMGTPEPTPGAKFLFSKRDPSTGSKILDSAGKEFPPQEVEIITSDPTNKTCTAKYSSNGKVVTDVRTKAPLAIKWEWLEAAPAF